MHALLRNEVSERQSQNFEKTAIKVVIYNPQLRGAQIQKAGLSPKIFPLSFSLSLSSPSLASPVVSDSFVLNFVLCTYNIVMANQPILKAGETSFVPRN